MRLWKWISANLGSDRAVVKAQRDLHNLLRDTRELQAGAVYSREVTKWVTVQGGDFHERIRRARAERALLEAYERNNLRPEY